MLQSISPYALLCASKPKPAPAYVTPYDLYSRQALAADVPAQPAPPPIREAPQPTQPAQRRTHYIADIHAKHGAADRRVSYTSEPIR